MEEVGQASAKDVKFADRTCVMLDVCWYSNDSKFETPLDSNRVGPARQTSRHMKPKSKARLAIREKASLTAHPPSPAFSQHCCETEKRAQSTSVNININKILSQNQHFDLKTPGTIIFLP